MSNSAGKGTDLATDCGNQVTPHREVRSLARRTAMCRHVDSDGLVSASRECGSDGRHVRGSSAPSVDEQYFLPTLTPAPSHEVLAEQVELEALGGNPFYRKRRGR